MLYLEVPQQNYTEHCNTRYNSTLLTTQSSRKDCVSITMHYLVDPITSSDIQTEQPTAKFIHKRRKARALVPASTTASSAT